jgi:hypothetical protein
MTQKYTWKMILSVMPPSVPVGNMAPGDLGVVLTEGELKGALVAAVPCGEALCYHCGYGRDEQCHWPHKHLLNRVGKLHDHTIKVGIFPQGTEFVGSLDGNVFQAMLAQLVMQSQEQATSGPSEVRDGGVSPTGVGTPEPQSVYIEARTLDLLTD